MSPASFFAPRATLLRMSTRHLAAAILLALPAVAAAQASIAGKWTAKFPTQVGDQEYTYDFVAKGSTLTATMKSNLLGDSKADDGTVDGQKFTFTEVGSFMDMPLRFAYACELTSADEAKCTRTLEGVGGEDLVMKRTK
jgi:hypothetical protein